MDTTSCEYLKVVLKPPSAVLKLKFMELKGSPVTEEFLESAARNVLLTVGESRIWIDQLSTVLENRRRGAVKAAATRKAKRQGACYGSGQREQEDATSSHRQLEQGGKKNSTAAQSKQSKQSMHGGKQHSEQSKEDYSGLCGASYSSSTAEFWIACDLCDTWYCGACEQLTQEPSSDEVYFLYEVYLLESHIGCTMYFY